MSFDKHALAVRFAALPAEKRRAFLQALAQKGIDFARLPIAPMTLDTSSGRPMSYAQQRLWFMTQMGRASSAYHIPALLRFRGKLDTTALSEAFSNLSARHASLRTTFRTGADDQPEQVIHEHLPVALRHVDLSAVSDRDAQARQVAEDEARAPFDLESGPLLRLTLVRLAQEEHLLLLCMHHIISDGWSVDLLIRELAQGYRAALAGQPADFAPLPIQYADYAQWQRYWLDAGERDRQLVYWKRQLGSSQPVLELPADRPRPPVQSFRGARHAFALGHDLSIALRSLAQREGGTLFMVLLAAFQLLLARYSGQRDIRVGVPVANRHRSETEGVIGFFINTQVLRAEVDSRASFTVLLKQVREAVLGAQAHQDLPFEQLVEALQPERSLAYNPLVQVKFTQQIALPAQIELPELILQPEPLPDYAARFDLSLDFTDFADGIDCVFSYATDLFEAATVEGFAQSYARLLRGVVAAPQSAIANVGFAADTVPQGETIDWRADNVVALWDACVRTAPDAAAVQVESNDDTQRYSYRAIDDEASRLATHLRWRGAGPETRIGLCTSRSLGLVLGIWGILKAGAVFVPIDPKLPADRVRTLLQDSGVKLILVDDPGELPDALGAVEVISLAGGLDGAWRGDAPAQSPALHPAQAAYVIYTSGSTGRPKGVAVAHGALANYVQGMLRRLAFPADASMAMVSTVAADLGHTTLFGALCSGRLLHLISAERAFDPDRFAEYMREHAVGVLKIVPSHLAGLLHAARQADVLPIHALILGGETAHRDLLETVRRLAPACRIVNHYGPTETTVGVLTCETDAREDLPIGLPLPNAEAHVLDADLNQLPAGVPGELYLGGDGLARGYLGHAALTAERFVPDPFGAAGARVYRSGDRVRRRADGAVDFLGRLDDQVKVRGYRVELREITLALRTLQDVTEAEVMLIDAPAGGAAQLAAYLVPRDGYTLDMSALKTSLAAQLPDYMVPTHWTVLQRMPLTANGKLDRSALLALRALPVAGAERAASLPPDVTSGRNTLSAAEQILSEIWCAVLRVDRVGLHDNFFALGGDSILSLQIIARARRQDLKLVPKQLFEHQTIAALAAVAQVAAATVIPTLIPVTTSMPAASEVPLTPAQSRFFQLAIPNRNHWNQALLFDLAGPLPVTVLARALDYVVAQHAALRMRYRQDDAGRWSQTEAAPAAGALLLWEREMDDAEAIGAACDQAQRSLDLRDGPLLRAVHFRRTGLPSQLFIAIHHLAIDGVSWRILLEDLQTASTQLQSGQAVQLAPVETTVQAWAARLHRAAASGAFDAELAYWQREIPPHDDQIEQIDFPIDVLPNGEALSECIRDAETVTMRLDVAHTQALLQSAPAAYRTRINDLLLSALARAMHRWTGRPHTLIELEGHGREDWFEALDLSRTVGWLTSVFPLRLHAADGIGATIKGVKSQLRALPENGSGFGVLRDLAGPSVRAAVAMLAQPQLTFNYLGQFDRGRGEAMFLPSFGAIGGERDPAGPLTNRLNVYGQIADGELVLNWIFSRAMDRRETIERLAGLFREELLAVIVHCIDPQAGGLCPVDVPLAQASQAQLDRLLAVAGPVRAIEDIYPLAPMQQGLWFHAQFALQQPSLQPSYVNQLRAVIDAPDIERLQAAWQAAVMRHAILRTGFWQDEAAAPRQVVYRDAVLPFDCHDFSGEPDSAVRQARLDALCEAEYAAPFDFLHAPLMRIALVRLDARRHCLIWTRHHLLLDGWSSARLLAEVARHYHGMALDDAPRLRYRDYIGWLARQEAEPARVFWRKQLQTLDEPTLLAAAFPRAETATATADRVVRDFAWDASATARIALFARDQRVTLNTVVQAAWALLLWRYTGKATVAFGVTVAGRPAELVGIEHVLGLFINTLPVVHTVQAGAPVGAWLRTLQATNVEMRDAEITPLYEIQQLAGQGGQALFDSLIVFENYPIERALIDDGGLRLEDIVNEESTHYPMTLSVAHGRTLTVRLAGDAGAFSDAAMDRLQAHFMVVVDTLVQDAMRPLADIGMTTLAEKHLLQQWCAPEVPEVQPLPAFVPVHEAVARRAALQPEALALTMGDEPASWLSYGELERRANRLAHRLIALGVRAEVRVGIGCRRSCDMIVAMLAVLKSGGAWVPLDIDYPAERLAYSIGDAGIEVLITQDVALALLPVPAGVRVLNLDAPIECRELALASDTAPAVEVHPAGLAYLIYTSGSTGKPKGVAVPHGALTAHCAQSGMRYGMRADDCVLQFASISFDAAIEDWLLPLIAGARVVLRGQSLWSAEQICNAVQLHGITTLHIPPAQITHLAQWLRSAGRQLLVRTCIAGGEAWSRESFALIQETLTPEWRINAYGPTETVITPMLWRADAGMQCDAPSVPIGRQLGSRGAYVLSADLHLLPPGVPGELYLGGMEMARGYFARPGATAERFIPDPFGPPGSRLYRTGDLVRWRDDGLMEFLGRADHQIKIRGVRIEPAEIETCLYAHSAVAAAVVIAVQGEGGKQLAAYVVPKVNDGISLAALRTHLQAHLPDMLVPAHLILIDALPLTPNGKIDRRALPAPLRDEASHAAPQTGTEQQLALLWEALLGVDRVGRGDNFFALGGHSLLATQLISRVNGQIGVQTGAAVTLRQLFETPTLAAFAQAVDAAAKSGKMIDRLDALLNELEAQ